MDEDVIESGQTIGTARTDVLVPCGIGRVASRGPTVKPDPDGTAFQFMNQNNVERQAEMYVALCNAGLCNFLRHTKRGRERKKDRMLQ